MNRMQRSNTIKVLAASLVFFALGVALSLLVGAVSSFDKQIFWILRAPRTISAIAVGGGLAVAGTLVQASLGNPLADPYTIGIASAAALGAVLGSLIPGHQLISASSGAFVFALGSLFFLSIWLRKSFRHATEVLLVGVISGFFFSALATLVMALVDPAVWSSTLVWIIGTLGNLSLTESLVLLALMSIASFLGWLHWKPLDLIAIDELSAESAGVDVARVRKKLFMLTALITAMSVSVAGVIGFLGLIVPHLLRRLGVRSHFSLIPCSFIAGAALLLCSDVFARVIVRPSEIPVGVVMAILGAPFFLVFAKRAGGST